VKRSGPGPPAAFPSPRGRSLDEVRRAVGPGPVLAPSVSVLEPGVNRFGFALFDRARAQVADVPAVLYVAPAAGGPASGPFPARYESLAVDAPYRSRSTSEDPDAARSVYTASVPFPRAGRHRVLAVARFDDDLAAAEPVTVEVGGDPPVPRVGERAPRTPTPTTDDVGGNVEAIDTREPPSGMHEVDFAEALGDRPVVLLFSSPALCVSRVCGPVNDIAEQVRARHDGRTAFIHQEIYEQNRVEAGFRRPVSAWGLPTEPWLFAVDRRGRIAARIEGAFSARELEDAVRRAERR
jgi:hypothetical protein